MNGRLTDAEILETVAQIQAPDAERFVLAARARHRRAALTIGYRLG